MHLSSSSMASANLIFPLPTLAPPKSSSSLHLRLRLYRHLLSRRNLFSLTSLNPRRRLFAVAKGRLSPPFAVPISSTQDSIFEQIDEPEEEEEEEDDASATRRGSDWGQQEETLSISGGEAQVEEGSPSGFSPRDVNASQSLKLFVGNLPFGVDGEELAQLFSRAGKVDAAEVIYDQETDRSRGFGFVTMCDTEGVEKAINMFHQNEMDGRLLTVNKASPRGSRPVQNQSSTRTSSIHKIYVGNIPWKVDEAQIKEIFAEHGEVVDVRIVYDQDSGRSRGFGFVNMSLGTRPEDVIAALDGKNLEGRNIRVQLAARRP